MSKNNFQGLRLQCLNDRKQPVGLYFGHMLIPQRYNVQAIGWTQRTPGKKLAQTLLQPPPRFPIHIGSHKHRFLHPKAPVSFEQFRGSVAQPVVFEVVADDVVHSGQGEDGCPPTEAASGQ